MTIRGFLIEFALYVVGVAGCCCADPGKGIWRKLKPPPLVPRGLLCCFLLRRSSQGLALARNNKALSASQKGLSFVGVAGFEPTTSCSQSRRDTGLRYTPNWYRSLFITAEEEGFEPSVPLPVRQFSKLFLSATQASLRILKTSLLRLQI
jgi:hypothetical protein